jgi:NAD(P)H dehydrogenase (quinone)
MKKIAIILGHPSPDSYCASLAHTYATAAQAQGHSLRWIDLSSMQFDPVLRAGYRQAQPLETDLKLAQETLQWAEHWVFAYRKNSVFWDKLMAGRSAQLNVTLDTPAWYFRWVYRMPGHNQMRRTILEWIGVKTVKLVQFGPVQGSGDLQGAKWHTNKA